MKKLLVTLVFVVIGIRGMDLEIIAVTKQRSGHQKPTDNLDAAANSLDGRIKFPMKIGNKSFNLSDIAGLTPEQRNIMFKISNPHCCLRPYGVDFTSLRENDIAELKKMPEHIKKDLGVFMIKEKPFFNDRCLSVSSSLSMFPTTTGIILSFSGGLATGGPVPLSYTLPVLWAGLGIFLCGAVPLATCGLIKCVQPCLCTDKEWVEIDKNEISTQEMISLDGDTSNDEASSD